MGNSCLAPPPAAPVFDIVFDNKSAFMKSNDSKPGRSQPKMSHLCNVLDRACRRFFYLTGGHIKSHADHPWNELSDSLCNHHRKNPNNLALPFGPILPSFVPYIDLHVTMSHGNIYQQTLGSEYWLDPCKCWHAFDSEVFAERIDDTHAVNPYPYGPLCALFVQYNVQSLANSKQRDTLRVLHLKHEVFCGCYQEARRSKACYYEDSDFVYCGSAAQNGNYACEIWLNKSIVLARSGDSKVRVSLHNVSIIVSEPRILAIIVDVGPYQFAVIGAHAPYGVSEYTSKWWNKFVSVDRSIKGKAEYVICGVDSNMAFNSEVVRGNRVGYVGAHKPPLRIPVWSKKLCRLLTLFSLYVP